MAIDFIGLLKWHNGRKKCGGVIFDSLFSSSFECSVSSEVNLNGDSDMLFSFRKEL